MDGKYVFISYSSKDTEQTTWIKNTLESYGIQCWMAKKSIHGGKDFSGEIQKALTDCSAFVLVLTKNSQESGWVRKEVTVAETKEKRILPFVLDNTPLNDSFSYFLSDVQMYNAVTNPEKEIENLIRDIREEFNAPAEKVKIRKKMPKSKDKGEKVKMKLWKKLAIALLVLCILIGGIQSLSEVLSTDIADNNTSLSQSLYDTTKATENNNSDWFVDKEEETADPYEELLNNLTFELDGVTYTLPCNVSELYENGWVCETREKDEVQINFYVEMKKGNSSIWIKTYSPFEYENAKFIDQKVGTIEYTPDCNVSFSVNGTIQPGSHYNDIIAEFGEPESSGSRMNDTEYCYFVDDNNYNTEASFIFYTDTSRCHSITLKNEVYSKNY